MDVRVIMLAVQPNVKLLMLITVATEAMPVVLMVANLLGGTALLNVKLVTLTTAETELLLFLLVLQTQLVLISPIALPKLVLGVVNRDMRNLVILV